MRSTLVQFGESLFYETMSTGKKVEDSEKFSGKKDGITFEKLDEKVLSWGRRKFGDKYATLLWKNELYDLNKYDLTDELDLFDFEMHCTLVYDVMCYDSAKYVRHAKVLDHPIPDASKATFSRTDVLLSGIHRQRGSGSTDKETRSQKNG